MKKFILPLFLLLSVIEATATGKTKPADSVGVALISGNYFVIHEVNKGQGLYALTKVYKVSMQEILEANPGMLPAVKTGQLVYIPLKNFKAPAGIVLSAIENGKLVGGNGGNPPEQKTETPKKQDEEVIIPPKKNEPAETPNPAEPEKFNWKNYTGEQELYHEVKSGETLYKIATFYGLTVQEIMDLNGLENSVISKGQKLLIKKAKKQTPPKTEPKEEKQQPREQPKETPKTAPKEAPAQPKQTEEEEREPKEIIETGMALVIDKNFPDADKNIALHTKADAGTLILVTNPANGRTLVVRVVGKLETDDKDLIMMISPAAANELAAPLTGKVKLSLSYGQ